MPNFGTVAERMERFAEHEGVEVAEKAGARMAKEGEVIYAEGAEKIGLPAHGGTEAGRAQISENNAQIDAQIADIENHERQRRSTPVRVGDLGSGAQQTPSQEVEARSEYAARRAAYNQREQNRRQGGVELADMVDARVTSQPGYANFQAPNTSATWAEIRRMNEVKSGEAGAEAAAKTQEEAAAAAADTSKAGWWDYAKQHKIPQKVAAVGGLAYVVQHLSSTKGHMSNSELYNQNNPYGGGGQ
jgi:hypothetical protein